MNEILESVEGIISAVSGVIWPIFLPFILILGAFLSFKTIFVVQRKTTEKSKVRFKNVLGPASISLGAMVGTGAIIGVLGSLSSIVGRGQANLEAMAIWAVIGAVVMVPLSYSETLCSKVMKQMPKDYIKMLLSPTMGSIYAVSFAALYIFGFGGFQFSGIDSVVTILGNRYLNVSFSLEERYLYIVIPICIIVAVIVLTKKHALFINAMTYMIGTAVAAYFLFFIIFIAKTYNYIPVYFNNMLEGIKNPVNIGIGVPLGLVFGIQRVIQTAETGLGALAMSAAESKSEPREAAFISLIPTIVTIFVSILVTSYITSYGVFRDTVNFPADSLERIRMYFDTAVYVTGNLGLIVLSLFTLLSALTTLLGSYYFLNVLFENSENLNIIIYLLLVVSAGSLAVFGFNIVFDAVDLLLFVVAGINVLALTKFSHNYWRRFQ